MIYPLTGCIYRHKWRFQVEKIKKFDDFLNENEFTKLATKFMDKMDREMNFRRPNDDVRIYHLEITFPDDVKLRFKAIENLHSDTETFTLEPMEKNPTSREYIKLYGNKLQFDDYNAYKRIRLYMNIDDLIGNNFDGYIYCPDKLGSVEVNIDITDSSIKEVVYKLPFIRKGIFSDASEMFLTIQSVNGLLS